MSKVEDDLNKVFRKWFNDILTVKGKNPNSLKTLSKERSTAGGEDEGFSYGYLNELQKGKRKFSGTSLGYVGRIVETLDMSVYEAIERLNDVAKRIRAEEELDRRTKKRRAKKGEDMTLVDEDDE